MSTEDPIEITPHPPLGERVAQLEAWRDHSIETRLNRVENVVARQSEALKSLGSEVNKVREGVKTMTENVAHIDKRLKLVEVKIAGSVGIALLIVELVIHALGLRG